MDAVALGRVEPLRHGPTRTVSTSPAGAPWSIPDPGALGLHVSAVACRAPYAYLAAARFHRSSRDGRSANYSVS